MRAFLCLRKLQCIAEIAVYIPYEEKENPIKKWINRIGKFRQEKIFSTFSSWYDICSLIFETLYLKLIVFQCQNNIYFIGEFIMD